MRRATILVVGMTVVALSSVAGSRAAESLLGARAFTCLNPTSISAAGQHVTTPMVCVPTP